jgi:hypothetical protein
MPSNDNPVLKWLVYQFAWLIVRRSIRRNRKKLIAGGVIALVVAAGGFVAVRSAAAE